jgi:Flp pilus assembly pilin Flp
MTFLNLIKRFHNDEAGAVTVDWVVLTAAIVGLGIAVVASVSGGVRGLGTAVATSVGTSTVGQTGVTVPTTTGTVSN